jgi:hypothetical protein
MAKTVEIGVPDGTSIFPTLWAFSVPWADSTEFPELAAAAGGVHTIPRDALKFPILDLEGHRKSTGGVTSRMLAWIRSLFGKPKGEPILEKPIKTALTDMASHTWKEYRRGPDDPQHPNWLMNRCGRCGYEYPLEQTAIYPGSCDEELVRRIMSR